MEVLDADMEEPVSVLPDNTDHLYVYRTDSSETEHPSIDGISIYDNWDMLLADVFAENFKNRSTVRVDIYPCAPIQCLDEV